MFLSPELLDSRSITAFSLGVFAAAAVGVATCAEQNVTVPLGTPALRTTDAVFAVAVAGSGNAARLVGARVVNATTIALIFCNPTAAALTPASDTYQVVVVRS